MSKMALDFRYFTLSRLFERGVSIMKTLHVLIVLVLAAMPIFVLAIESESEPDAHTHH